jgi:hypothetical protein
MISFPCYQGYVLNHKALIYLILQVYPISYRYYRFFCRRRFHPPRVEGSPKGRKWLRRAGEWSINRARSLLRSVPDMEKYTCQAGKQRR